MSEVTEFSLLSHIFISFIGGVLLLALWFYIRKQFKQILEEDSSQKRVDKGLLYLSLAMFVWVISGCWGYASHQFSFSESTLYQVGVNLLSIINNLFLLLALFYFYYAPKFIYNNKRNVLLILVLIVITSIATFGISYSLGATTISEGIKITGIPDLILSGFLCYLLGVSFYRTFAHRGLSIIAIISTFVILLMFVSQLSGVFVNFGNDFSNNLIKIIAKTSLISIFLVLATTWAIRLASMPKPNEITIKFIDWSIVIISIPSKNVFDKTIDFGSKTTQFKNLLKFAIRRKYSEGDTQSINVSLGGEIKNQTYLSRIIDNINAILQLEKAQQLERRDLLTFIGEGKYRLRMIPTNIEIDPTLLSEFVENSENKAYKTFCD
ncbi:MAG: hypothetical protein COB12_06380 [Flavobacterium sp.]|nr:MAG: hypothetical protein COB12_06380 [Flavobacterium sp.]